MRDEQRTRFVSVAHRIARRMVTGATWQGDQLSWTVVQRDYAAADATSHVRELADPWLYSGTAGIALALAELAVVTDDANLRAAARGTLQASLSVPPTAAFSFHCGDVGRAWVALRVARLFEDDASLAAARQLLGRVREGLRTDRALDVIGGSAGAIPALLSIARDGALEGTLELAIEAGEHLVRHAVRRGSGWSWKGVSDNLQDLCGYAHGVSGFVHAFLELYAVTNDPRWRHAAQRGLEYERRHRISGTGDWPDYRCAELSRLRVGPNGNASRARRLSDALNPIRPAPGTFRAWCHGAPGIAMVRARASELGLTDLEEMEAVFEATAASLSSPVGNASLCHGLLGNAEALLHAPPAIKNRHAGEVIASIEGAIGHYGDGAKPWRTGAFGGLPDPSLMLGDAGIVHGLLRFAVPGIPSVTFVTCGTPAQRTPARIPASVLREELNALLPRTARVAAQLAEADGVLATALTRLDADRDIASLLDELAPSLERTDPRHPMSVAWTQDRAALDADARFTNYVEQLGILTRAAAAADVGVDEPLELAPEVELLAGTDETVTAEGGAVSALALARGEHSIRCLDLTPLQFRALEALRTPTSVRDLSTRLLAEADDAQVRVEELEGALAHFVNTLLRAGVLRQLEAISA